jgi:rhodanese-related sulfurtransferase
MRTVDAKRAQPVEIDSEELQRLLARRSDVALIDVRSPGEHSAVHIPASHNLPLEHLQTRHPDLAPHLHGPVVMVCAQGLRARQAANLLRDDGVSDIRILDGGINSWIAGGGDVRRGRGHWAMDRQVRLAAGTMILSGMAASIAKPAARWLAAGVGAGLTYSAVTNSCAMAAVLGRLPYNRNLPGYDFDEALGTLRDRAAAT